MRSLFVLLLVAVVYAEGSNADYYGLEGRGVRIDASNPGYVSVNERVDCHPEPGVLGSLLLVNEVLFRCHPDRMHGTRLHLVVGLALSTYSAQQPCMLLPTAHRLQSRRQRQRLAAKTGTL
jgi:hypothetical protein